MASPDPATLAAIGRLLTDVFEVDPPVSVEHLRWQYLDNPEGRAAIGMVTDHAAGADPPVHVGNYALIPLTLDSDRGRVTVGIGIDLCVAPAARGAGTFRRTVEAAYRDGLAEGIDAILGVANANSAPRMAKTLGWRVLDALPARFLFPGRPARLESQPVTPDVLAHMDELVGDLPVTARPGFAHRWTTEHLAWRLGRTGASYHIHVGADVVAVSTLASVKGLRVAVLLKALPRRAGASVRSSRLAGAVARYHRTPLVLHWGRNAEVDLRGITLPRRFQPSPLELVLHGLHDGFDREGFQLATFEFLEFDAY